MKYNVENLLKLREDNLFLKGGIGVGLSNTIVKAITIKRDLEDIEKVIIKPERTNIDIMTHAKLIKDYGENRKKQVEILKNSGNLLSDIAKKLEEDYNETIRLIKS
ncbi:MAG: hypothetical protein K2H30_00215 [Clostridia bacterium]|nr:hypothetical protein [Clostridia bacterium]MDE7265334.1 hypothetical protein [Clostridia bacterium]